MATEECRMRPRRRRRCWTYALPLDHLFGYDRALYSSQVIEKNELFFLKNTERPIYILFFWVSDLLFLCTKRVKFLFFCKCLQVFILFTNEFFFPFFFCIKGFKSLCCFIYPLPLMPPPSFPFLLKIHKEYRPLHSPKHLNSELDPQKM
jgi:hypothetical protein